MPITVAAIREAAPGETRVAITPEVASKLQSRGLRVLLELELGDRAGFPDQAYSGVAWADRADALGQADVLLCVSAPEEQELSALRQGAVLVGQLRPYGGESRLRQWADRGLSSFSLELLPRTTRAQAMDVLSSQAAVAGYRAVLLGAEAAPKLFPMLTTAAGTLRPCKVMVIGAGVAGLQAIATARRLGAQVEGYDVRPETREQIQSLGAKFVELAVSAAGEGGYARELTAEERSAQQQALAEHLKGIDVLITTAAVPGRPSPRILTAAMVEGMRSGAVIVDLAADGGGNTELTRVDETVHHNGVTILGPANPASGAPRSASELYSRNLLQFLDLLLAEGELAFDFDDELLAETCLTHGGELRFARN